MLGPNIYRRGRGSRQKKRSSFFEVEALTAGRRKRKQKGHGKMIKLSPHWPTMTPDQRYWHKIELARAALKITDREYFAIDADARFEENRGFFSTQEHRSRLLSRLSAMCVESGIDITALETPIAQ